MIISGKSFLHNSTFGSADSTFLFPWAIYEYVLATGDISYLRNRWKRIVDLVNWGLLKDIDGDGLVENGFTGIAEKLPLQDSTWMDHIDRRKSANDVQALFYESLRIGGKLASIVGDNHNQEHWNRIADRLLAKVEREYWNSEDCFYYDTIRRDGTKDPSIRPNVLVMLLTDLVGDKVKAQSVLSRIEKSDLTTAWGVRTLSNLDPKYHPSLYHDGAVWPLVTGWAAVSELKMNRLEQALYYLESMAQRIHVENAMFAETYRGDRPEPFNSCILQAWSVGMYTYAIQQMMLGMRLDMIENRIYLEPRIPESLRNQSYPIEFEHTVRTITQEQRYKFIVDLNRERITVSLPKDKRVGKLPEILSNSYSINIDQT